MARKDYGTLKQSNYQVQPDRTITEKNDGSLEGEVVYVCDESKEFALPKVGSSHPDNNKLKLFQLSKTYTAIGTVKMSASYIGITQDPTTPVESFQGGSGQEPIEVHPQFKYFAGDIMETDSTADTYVTPILKAFYTYAATPDSVEEISGTEAEITAFLAEPTPARTIKKHTYQGSEVDYSPTGIAVGLNGARFDSKTGEFIGFSDPANTKCGQSAYIKCGDQVAVTYWTYTVPDWNKRDKIFTTFPYASVAVNSEVVNWLFIDMVPQRVGTLYKVTEIYLGSDRTEGWDEDVYQKYQAPKKTRSTDFTV